MRRGVGLSRSNSSSSSGRSSSSSCTVVVIVVLGVLVSNIVGGGGGGGAAARFFVVEGACRSFRKLGVPSFGVHIIGILLFKLIYQGPPFSETPMCRRRSSSNNGSLGSAIVRQMRISLLALVIRTLRG